MRSFGWLMLLTAFWVLVELSFFDMLLPSVRAPLFLLAYAVAMPVVLGERAGLLWATGSVLVYDILRLGTLTPAVLFAALAALLTSLLVDRLRFDFGFKSRFSLALWLVVLVVAYDTLILPFAWPSWLELGLALPASLLVLTSIAQLKAWLDLTSLSEFRGMRHS